ncbi:MAG TPA: PQQ-binding-like beta-propeller repeat protein, partial [Kofleriaceae bacterium]|nr:PQQ-binding-like beta-propeller repeat protein [Kofleriaceae bacterium]
RGAREAGFEASPVITGDIVWIADTAGRLSALSLATGDLLWSRELDVPVLAGVAVAGDWLVVASYDGSVRAFAPSAHATPVRKPASCDAGVRAGCCDAGGAPSSGVLVLVVAVALRRRYSVKIVAPQV